MVAASHNAHVCDRGHVAPRQNLILCLLLRVAGRSPLCSHACYVSCICHTHRIDEVHTLVGAGSVGRGGGGGGGLDISNLIKPALARGEFQVRCGTAWALVRIWGQHGLSALHASYCSNVSRCRCTAPAVPVAATCTELLGRWCSFQRRLCLGSAQHVGGACEVLCLPCGYW